jgi:hypothetical protein
MKRLLWLGAGLAIGALVVRAVSRKAQSLHPSGIAATARDSGRNLLAAARDFVDDVREGMHEREQELRAALADGTDLWELAEPEDYDDLQLAEFEDLDQPAGGPGGRAAPAPPPEGTNR